LEEKLYIYRKNWLQDIHGKEDRRLPKQILKHHPRGGRARTPSQKDFWTAWMV